jgi:hypothetical protein
VMIRWIFTSFVGILVLEYSDSWKSCGISELTANIICNLSHAPVRQTYGITMTNEQQLLVCQQEVQARSSPAVTLTSVGHRHPASTSRQTDARASNRQPKSLTGTRSRYGKNHNMCQVLWVRSRHAGRNRLTCYPNGGSC